MLKRIAVALGAVAVLVGIAAPSASAREPLPDSTTGRFLNQALREVNAVRARHHAPPLVLDDELTDYARIRARNVSRQWRLNAGHDGLRPSTGENLYWAGSYAPVPRTAHAAVQAWYREVDEYAFDDPGFSHDTGHFTQLVWKDTTRLGAARVSGAGPTWNETYIVFAFEEPGNYSGQFRRNVLRP